MPVELEVIIVPIEQLKADPRNARVHNARNLAAIRKSLERFGQRKPLVVTKSMTVVAGNGTLEVAREIGMTELAVTIFPGSATDARAYALADNRTAELAAWDNDVLLDTLGALPEGLLDVTGWDENERAKLAAVDTAGGVGDAPVSNSNASWGVIVDCDSEAQQTRLLERLEAEGLSVRALVR